MKTIEYLSEQELLVKLLEEVQAIRKDLKDNSRISTLNIADNADLIRLLKTNARTLANWRKQGLISYKKLGGKIYYDLEEIKKMMKFKTD